MIDILVIGGGCAGLTASIYGARAGKKVLVLEQENVGGQISYSPRVENYPGISSISGAEFADHLYDQAVALGVEIDLIQVTAIEKDIDSFIVKSPLTEIKAKTVILATGVCHRKLSLDREEELSGKGVSYCTLCDGAFYKDEHVAVVGGGNTALQGAEFLSSLCDKVYLIHRREAFRGEEKSLLRLKGKKNVDLLTSSVVSRLCGLEELEKITVEDVQSNEGRDLSVTGIFVLIGQVPNNKPFEGFVKMDEEGFIEAGEDCKTSQAGVFVAGDCRKKNVRQLTTAAADGTVAALEALRYLDELSYLNP